MQAYRDWIMRADSTDFWFFASLALLIALIAFVHGLRSFWTLRIVVDTPTAKIRSAAQGHVELFGFARARREPLLAPLSETPCAWYRYQIEQERGSGRGKKWTTIKRGQAKHPFLLNDGTGECLVDPTGATLKFRNRHIWQTRKPDGYFGPRPTTHPAVRLFFGFDRNYRLTEERIHIDEPVYLLGHFETPRRDSRKRQRLARQLLRQWKRDPKRMRQFDLNQNGEVGLQEWQAAQALAQQIAEQTEQRLAAQPALPQVSKPKTMSQPFIISTLGEEALASGLRWQTGATIATTLILGIASSAAVLIRLSG